MFLQHMAAMHSAANLSKMNVHDVRRVLEIHHRENGIRLKKYDLIQKILVKQIAGETDYASASKGTLLPAQESHLERKEQALPVGKAGKKVTVSLQSLFASQQKRRSEETQGHSTDEKVTPPRRQSCYARRASAVKCAN